MPYYTSAVQSMEMRSPYVSKGLFTVVARSKDSVEPVIARMYAEGIPETRIIRKVEDSIKDILDSQREETLSNPYFRWNNPRRKESEYDGFYDCISEAARILVKCYKPPDTVRKKALGKGRRSGKRTVYDVPYTKDDWSIHGAIEALPGQQIDSDVYYELMDRSVLNADPKVLIDFGCVRGFRMSDNYSGNRYMTFGQTADGRYYYLGLFPPRKDMDVPLDPVTWDDDFDISTFMGGGASGSVRKEGSHKNVSGTKLGVGTRSRSVRSYSEDDDEDERIDTPEQMRQYVMRESPWTATYLKDPEIWGWLQDFYSYLSSNEHGNQASYREMAEEGYVGSDIIDLVERSDPYKTEYLTVQGDYKSIGPDEIDLLDRRAAIQRRFGVEPDWRGLPNKSSSSVRKAPKGSKRKASKPVSKSKKASKSKASAVKHDSKGRFVSTKSKGVRR